MDFCSYFIKDKALFGSYPTQERVEELENHGVRYFVSLVYDSETKIVLYKTQYNYINYPILDNKIPINWYKFSLFLIRLVEIIKKLTPSEMIYIHCKGGHGRSGLVVACLVSYLYNIPASESLEYTTEMHKQRKIMKDYWRKLCSPPCWIQKKFVYKFCSDPLKICDNSEICGLEITTPISFFLNQNEFDEIDILYFICLKCIYENIEKSDIKMLELLEYYIEQHFLLKKYLLNSGFRPIVYNNYNDPDWGMFYSFSSRMNNRLGKLLIITRYNFFKKCDLLK